MGQIANDKIQKYLSIIEDYYSLEPFPEAYGDEFLAMLSDNLKSAWRDAEMAADSWADLVQSIKSKPWAKGVRDWGTASSSGQVYKVIVGIEQPNHAPVCSIAVFLSFIGKQIGMLYVDSLAEGRNNRPFYEHSRFLSNEQPISFASYSPLNISHEKYTVALLKEINVFFPEFTFFDNQFADYKVKGVQTEGGYFTDIDLFMVFFDDVLGGIPP